MADIQKLEQETFTETECLEAIKKNSENPDAWFNLGKAYIEQKKPFSQQPRKREVLEAFLKTVQYQPGHEGAWCVLSWFFYNEEKEESEKILLRLLQEQPKSADAWENLGGVYNKQGKNGKAVEAYLKAIEYRPQDEHLRFSLGHVYLDQEKSGMQKQLFF